MRFEQPMQLTINTGFILVIIFIVCFVTTVVAVISDDPVFDLLLGSFSNRHRLFSVTAIADLPHNQPSSFHSHAQNTKKIANIILQIIEKRRIPQGRTCQ